MINVILLSALSLTVALVLTRINALSIGAALIIPLIPLVVAMPGLYFVFFIIGRPALDLAGLAKISGELNLASLATLLFILICGMMLLNRKKLSGIGQNRFLVVFNILFSLFTFISLCSFLNTGDAMASFSDFIRMISILTAVNYAVVYFKDKERRFFLYITASAVLPLAFGLQQAIFKTGLADSDFNRIFGTFLHPNVLAQYLVLIITVVMYQLTTFKERLLLKLVLYFTAVIAITELMFTFTRGAWIGLSSTFMIYLLIKTKPVMKLRFIMIGMLAATLIFPIAQKRFADLKEPSSDRINSWQWRLQQWEMTAQSINEHPAFGHGIGMYEKKFAIMAHNDYIRIVYETGFAGLGAYILFFMFILFTAIKRMLGAHSTEAINSYKAGICLIVSLLLMSFADNLARSTVVMIYFLITAGYLIGSNHENIAGA
ncbi:MAG: O-antigen ligase family protein [Candidatus Omnitrophica bacterium]|nr:O-antigen ligase family protein [Candidatus Omnitrophota bacterium]